jgi:hypothetical protein
MASSRPYSLTFGEGAFSDVHILESDDVAHKYPAIWASFIWSTWPYRSGAERRLRNGHLV